MTSSTPHFDDAFYPPLSKDPIRQQNEYDFSMSSTSENFDAHITGTVSTEAVYINPSVLSDVANQVRNNLGVAVYGKEGSAVIQGELLSKVGQLPLVNLSRKANGTNGRIGVVKCTACRNRKCKVIIRFVHC